MSALRKILVALSLPLVLLVVVGTIRARVEEGTDQTLRDLKVFSETLGLVSKFYVEDVHLGQLERGAYQGLAESLDPWSSYYDPQRMRQLLETERDADVGLLLVKLPQQYVRVAAVIPGSPADRAGIHRLQFLETIDGLATKDLTLLEARTMLAGPAGTRVEVGVPRETEEGEGRKIELVREDLDGLRLAVERPAPGTAVVRLTDLGPGAAQRLGSSLAELEREGVERLVLDLRTNVGGTTEEARRVAELFVAPGPLFAVKGREGQVVVSAAAQPAWTGKLVTLVSPSTVGEAELLAAALRQRGASVLVGMPTFGKFRKQDLVSLSDGSGLYMSVAEYRQAGGEPFEKGGVQPDEKVPRQPEGDETVPVIEPDETQPAHAEPQPADPAQAEPPAPDQAPAAGAAAPIDSPERDPQLERALEILAGAAIKKAA